MTDQEVMDTLRRQMMGVEHKLLADPPATEEQIKAMMAEMAKEVLAMLSPSPRRGVAEDVPAPVAPVAPAATAATSRQKS